ncbi:hypothetical protein Tcan_04760 [Toxocara canis]|uniref:Uncharacterized protein n=1 Tax=Toxocara canis TaxID=6265 RepID=A0A0B2V5N2_TOXCA|nr:hypothetical protein Tcan_04760 [Toxocara canis]
MGCSLFALLLLRVTFSVPPIYGHVLEWNDEEVSAVNRMEVTPSIIEPGALLDLRRLRPSGAWYVNSPGGVLQLFAVGTLVNEDEVRIVVNGSNVPYNVSTFLNSNKGVTLTTRQIVIHYPGQLHRDTNVLFYVRDINLRQTECGDPLVITDANSEVPALFSNNASLDSECAITIISRTEAAIDLYTITFTQLSTTSEPE